MKRDKAELENYLNDLFLKKKHPGVAVSVRGPEGVLFEKGFGYRNAEGDKPVDPDTVFGIASMSKSMTALACAILHAEKKLDLGDPMVKYFPNLHIPGAPDECVTLRNICLLNVLLEKKMGLNPEDYLPLSQENEKRFQEDKEA